MRVLSNPPFFRCNDYSTFDTSEREHRLYCGKLTTEGTHLRLVVQFVTTLSKARGRDD